MDIREVLRHVRQGRSNRAIARTLGIDRKTVRRYRDWAREQGLFEGMLPPAGDLERLLRATLNPPPPPQNVSSVEPYREIVEQLRGRGVEMAAIHCRLKERGYPGSYASVVRFVRRLEPAAPEVVMRVETPPGEEAQVDFGSAGRMQDVDGRLRKAWAFVMTLSWSRHQYVELVFDQKVETWLRCHRNAFEFFGGVPRRVVLDNLKTGIAKRCWEEPQAQFAYRECAEHYGFLIDPHKPGHPEHKGKVEQGGVHYVKRNFLAGRDAGRRSDANREVLRWVEETAGQRTHGTTRERPLERFEHERTSLQPLPKAPYDLATWKRVKLHRDGHVVFDKAYYSAPFRLRDQKLWVRGGAREVRIFTPDYQLAATEELLRALIEANDIRADSVISAVFSATPDLTAAYPAEAARSLGWTAAGLLCLQEMAVDGLMARCLRVLVLIDSDRAQSDLQDQYLRGARGLRPDLT